MIIADKEHVGSPVTYIRIYGPVSQLFTGTPIAGV